MTLQAGYEPLLKSISDGDLVSLKHLINAGQYSVNEEVRYYSEDDKNYIITPLYWAVKLNQKEMCGYLLKHGADPYRHMVYEFYPLHEACNSGNCGVVQEFIKNNCNLDKKNCDGDTPLHIACLRGHTECIKLLLSAGACRSEKNNKGQTPLQVAQFEQQKDLYELFNTDATACSSLTNVIRGSHPVAQRPNNHTIGSNATVKRSFSTQCQKQPRPLSYHSTTQDFYGTNTNMTNQRIKSLRSDVTRTYSFTGGTSHSSYRRNDSNRNKEITLSSKKELTAPNRRSQRPSLSYMSHDSQLVLPTQKPIPDPRRTQTCHEFQNLPHLKSDQNQLKKSTPSPEPALTPDDIEVDAAIHPRTQSNNTMTGSTSGGGRVRVNHMVQCINPILKSRDVSTDGPVGASNGSHLITTNNGTTDIHNDCLLKVLYSIHREIGFSDDDYSAITPVVSEDVSSNRSPPSVNQELEYVWGCDYDLVEPRHPLRVIQDEAMTDHLEMTFHVQLDIGQASSRSKDKDSLLKVLVELLNLEDKEQLDDYVNHRVLLCREGQIMSSIPPHPNIVKRFHHCLANSRPFERFTRHFCTTDGEQQSRKLSPQCSLVFTDYFPTTLKDVFNVSHLHHPGSANLSASHGFTQQSFLINISQLLLAMIHLDRHSIILGNISASRVFIEHDRLYFGDFTFAFDLLECDNDETSLKQWLLMVPKENLLKFPPELCRMLESSMDTSLQAKYLDKCNVHCVGKLFHELFSSSAPPLAGPTSSKHNLDSYGILSEPSQYLLRNLMSNDSSERFSAIDATLFSLALQFGPLYEKCNTIESCQEWLMTETFHLYLQPSLKGYPNTYKPDIQTKLLYTYLCIATPEKLLVTIKRINRISS